MHKIEKNKAKNIPPRHVDKKIRTKSCAIDFQTESVLALNKKLKVNWKFQLFI